jgi:hypothetical protein
LKSKSDIPVQKAKPNPAGKGKDTMGQKTKSGSSKTRPGDVINDHLSAVEYTGNIETDISAEDAAMKLMLREADTRYAADRELVTEAEYWFCLVFESRDQKETFLKAMGWWLIGDKYLDGTEVARRQNIPLPIVRFPAEKATHNKRFDNLVDPAID